MTQGESQQGGGHDDYDHLRESSDAAELGRISDELDFDADSVLFCLEEPANPDPPGAYMCVLLRGHLTGVGSVIRWSTNYHETADGKRWIGLVGPVRRKYSEGCSSCTYVKAVNGFGPAHDASPDCKSGRYSHCACDTCF